MDVKSAFLYDLLNEEVYVAQPPRCVNHIHHSYVYKLDEALYGLKQAPHSWYDTLKKFILENDFVIKIVDKTLFKFSKVDHSLYMQIYVYDIIFGFTKVCEKFSKLMQKHFEMNMM